MATTALTGDLTVSLCHATKVHTTCQDVGGYFSGSQLNKQVVSEAGSSMLTINRHYLDRETWARDRQLDLPVGVYTANSRRQMVKLVDNGVHSIFTDHPDVLLEVLAERTATR